MKPSKQPVLYGPIRGTDGRDPGQQFGHRNGGLMLGNENPIRQSADRGDGRRDELAFELRGPLSQQRAQSTTRPGTGQEQQQRLKIPPMRIRRKSVM